jgi:hypothetical protein
VTILIYTEQIRYDVRGHGQSDQPLFPEAYESVHHAEDLDTVCEAFRVKKPFLAGWSVQSVPSFLYPPNIYIGRWEVCFAYT